MALAKGHRIRYIDGYENIEKVATVGTIDTILNALDLDSKTYRDLIKCHGNVSREENFQITKHLYKLRLGVKTLDKKILKMYFRKEHHVKNFIELISPDVIFQEDIWNKKDIFDTNLILKQTIVKEIVNELNFEIKNLTKSIPYDIFQTLVTNLVNNSIMFTKFNEIRSLFGLRKQNKWNFIEKTRSTILYLNALLNQYNLKIKKTYLGGKRKTAKHSVYSLETVNYVEHVVHNLLRSGKLTYIAHSIRENILDIIKVTENHFEHLFTSTITNESNQEENGDNLTQSDDESKQDENRNNLTQFDDECFDQNRFDCNGYNKDGYSKDGYNKDGYNKDGYNKDGYNKDGYNKDGYSKDGYNKDGYSKDGYNKDGYNKDGYNKDGYNKDGYNKDGYNKDGYNKDGYDNYNKHKNCNLYCDEGYNKDGYNEDEYNKDGFDKYGYNKDGYDKNGLFPYQKIIDNSTTNNKQFRDIQSYFV